MIIIEVNTGETRNSVTVHDDHSLARHLPPGETEIVLSDSNGETTAAALDPAELAALIATLSARLQAVLASDRLGDLQRQMAGGPFLADDAVTTTGPIADGQHRLAEFRSTSARHPQLYCGATSFSSPHRFEPGGWEQPGYRKWELCDHPAGDPIHLADENEPTGKLS